MESSDGDMQFPSHITVTTYLDWPYSNYFNQSGEIIGNGYAFDLLELVRRNLNFTYTILPPKTDEIGDGYSGMLQQLNNSEVDMAVAFIPILNDFRNFCEFSVPLEEMDTTFLLKRPPTSAKGSDILAPFDTLVWILILLSLMVVGPTIFIIIFFRSKFAPNGQFKKFTFFNCMWFVYGASFKQGTTIVPIGDSTRLVFATWWIFITILSSYYTASLTAILTSSTFTLGIDSVTELIQSREKWLVIGGKSVQTLIRYRYGDARYLGNYLNSYGFIPSSKNMSWETVLQTVAGGRYVFITDRSLAHFAIFEDYKKKTLGRVKEEKKCPYVISEKNVLPVVRGFAFSKQTNIQQRIDNELTNAVEAGLLQHIIEERNPPARYCPLKLKSKEKQVRMSDLLLTYKIVFCGMGIAVIVFVLELMSRFHNKCSRMFLRRLQSSNRIINKGTHEYREDNTKFETDWIRTPPPIYQLHQDSYKMIRPKACTINGRDYYIIKGIEGDKKLIPIGTPSAYLFQYLH